MSTRLQVVMDPAELREISKIARRHKLTVSEWARQALRAARRAAPTKDAATKLAAIREASQYAVPVGDIADMLVDIDRGRGQGLP